MSLIIDAGPLVALADREDPLADEVYRIISEERGQLVLPAYVAAEADHLISRRIGPDAERAFLHDLASGVYDVQALTEDEHRLAVEIHQDHPGLGVAELSVVVLAARFRTRRLLTFDERDFRRVSPLDGGSFVLLPGDAGG